MLEGVVSIPHFWYGKANANILTEIHCREPIMGYPYVNPQVARSGRLDNENVE
jgi:hypothetical protein